jgi:hypothetical protein
VKAGCQPNKPATAAKMHLGKRAENFRQQQPPDAAKTAGFSQNHAAPNEKKF